MKRERLPSLQDFSTRWGKFVMWSARIREEIYDNVGMCTIVALEIAAVLAAFAGVAWLWKGVVK